MNKVIVLAFLCTFSCSLNLFSMEDRELLRQTTGKLFLDNNSLESDSTEEDSNATQESDLRYPRKKNKSADKEFNDECTSSSALVAMNSEEMLKDLSCFYCYASLINSSFMYSDLLDRYVCTDCARYYWSEEESDGVTFQHSEEHEEDYTYEFYQPLELSSDNKEVKQSKCILALKEFVEDEPLFDHKKENTLTHKINQRHQLKKSKQHWLKKQATCLSAPAKKQLRTLHKKANSIFSCK